MLSLKQLKVLQDQPTLFDVAVQETISNEDAYDTDEELSTEPESEWYVPKKSWKQFFAEREAGTIEGGWEIPEFNAELPKEIRLNAWTMITDVKAFVSSHLEVIKKYNGNKRFKPYLERLNELNSLIVK